MNPALIPTFSQGEKGPNNPLLTHILRNQINPM